MPFVAVQKVMTVGGSRVVVLIFFYKITVKTLQKEDDTEDIMYALTIDFIIIVS